MGGYLVFKRQKDEYVAVYPNNIQEHELTDEQILIIKVANGKDSRVKMAFNGDAYKIMRAEVIQSGFLREAVQRKIKRLEGRV